MRIIKSRETLKAEAIKESKVFLYNAIKAVEIGADIDGLLHIIDNMEEALKSTQAECIRLYKERSLESYRTEALYTSYIKQEGVAEND